MEITRTFDMFGDRYQYDQAFTYDLGWVQVDSDQDASYFGTWANPGEFKIAQFVEGDLTVWSCSREEFVTQLREMSAFEVEMGRRPIKVDCLGGPQYFPLRDAFVSLGLSDLIH